MAINVTYFVMLIMFVMFMAWFTIHMDIHIFIGHKHAYIFINTLDWVYYYSYVFFFFCLWWHCSMPEWRGVSNTSQHTKAPKNSRRRWFKCFWTCWGRFLFWWVNMVGTLWWLTVDHCPWYKHAWSFEFMGIFVYAVVSLLA